MNKSVSFANSCSANIAGLEVTGFRSLADAASQILTAAGSTGGFALAVNAEKIINYRHSEALRSMLGEATLRYPDGVGAVMALRRKGVESARIPGADLWLEVLRMAAQSGRSVRCAIVGGKANVNEETAQKLATSEFGCTIVLARDGYSGVQDLERLKTELECAGPELVLVAMGSPLQESLIKQLRVVLPKAYFLGLGGSFDVFTGRAKRAPRWMQKAGLEWLFRLLDDPRRITRQIKYIEFMYLLKMGKI